MVSTSGRPQTNTGHTPYPLHPPTPRDGWRQRNTVMLRKAIGPEPSVAVVGAMMRRGETGSSGSPMRGTGGPGYRLEINCLRAGNPAIWPAISLMQQVNLGMIGGGTVGSGVFHALQLNGDLMA